MTDKLNKLTGVADFLDVIAAIRDPKTGCPWDLAQTHESLLKYFVEEVHEFVEAMRQHGPTSPETWEELGDVLLQVALHTRMASEKGITDFDGVCARAAEKLRLRHPHVFDPEFPRFKTPAEVSAAWEKIKAWARTKQGHRAAAAATPTPPTPLYRSAQLENVPSGLSALLRGSRIGEKAASFAFDWPDASAVLDKVLEETEELVAAAAEETAQPSAKSLAHTKEEFGDLMFALVQYARKRGWDVEDLAEQANTKFVSRFRKMEQLVKDSGREWDTLRIDELEGYWQATKSLTLLH